MNQNGFTPVSEGITNVSDDVLLYNKYVAKVYNTFGVFTEDKRVIRELIACGCYL